MVSLTPRPGIKDRRGASQAEKAPSSSSEALPKAITYVRPPEPEPSEPEPEPAQPPPEPLLPRLLESSSSLASLDVPTGERQSLGDGKY